MRNLTATKFDPVEQKMERESKSQKEISVGRTSSLEKRHTNRIRKKFSEKIKGKRIVTLFIEDIYDPMEPALVDELRRKLRGYIHVPE